MKSNIGDKDLHGQWSQAPVWCHLVTTGQCCQISLITDNGEDTVLHHILLLHPPQSRKHFCLLKVVCCCMYAIKDNNSLRIRIYIKDGEIHIDLEILSITRLVVVNNTWVAKGFKLKIVLYNRNINVYHWKYWTFCWLTSVWLFEIILSVSII